MLTFFLGVYMGACLMGLVCLGVVALSTHHRRPRNDLTIRLFPLLCPVCYREIGYCECPTGPPQWHN